MSIGPEARKWFLSNHKNNTGKIYTSKYYLPEESWPKTHVWWLQIPLKIVLSNQKDYVNLICQVAPGKLDFHYLKVPIKFLYEHLKKFDIVQNKMIHLYLSAEPHKLFVEERGIGKLGFSRFLIRSL